MNNDLSSLLKSKATEVVRSHGAFGESERYNTINPDKLIEEVVRECLLVVRECKHPDSIYFVTRETTIAAIRDHFGILP